MALTLGAILLVSGVILFLLLPILRGEQAGLSRVEGELTDAQARKRAALKALRDVEYDYQTGKLDQADYGELKTALSRDALVAMEKVAAEGGSPGSGAVASEVDPNEDIEAEIARARAGLEAGTTCRACGHVNVDASFFCSMCGAGLAGDGAPLERTRARE